jgi:hypothetical protein
MFMAPQSASGGDAVSSCRVVYFRQTQPGNTQYIDVNPTAGVDSPIGIVIAVPPYWFQTERRKRINKIKVIMDGWVQPGTDSSVYALYIILTPDNVFDTSGSTHLQSRRIVIPTADQRYYDNNWGMHRVLNMCLVSITSDPMRIRAVEVDVAQGTA